MTPADRSLARRYFEDLINAGDIDVAEQILDPRVSFLGPITPAGIYGIEAYKEFLRGWYRGFPDRNFQLLQEWVHPESIATVFRITGTHQGEFLGQSATGNAVDVWAMNFLDLEGGRIRHIRAFFNPLDLLHPLGLAPTRNALELTHEA
jgi:predicted ester cyclase